MKDLGPDGKRNIVLVSDGQESCVPDPCPVVKKLTGAGINLQIDTVGFGVDAKARAQLQCIADAGNGTYYDARDADALTTSLNKLSQRALRPFTVSGKPIEGAYETIDGAPELAPGQYVDTFGGSGREKARTTGGFETTLYYRIKRTIPGSTPRISVTSRPPGRDATVAVEGWHLYLRTEDNKVCGQASELIRSETGRSEIVSASVSSIPKDPRLGEAGPDECATTDTLILSTARSGNGGPAPTEIRYVEEPPVTNESQLPGAVTSIDPKAASPASASGPTVIGGASFSDSERLTPGTYVTSVIPGEETFFRVAVDWGQSAVISVDGPADPSLYDRGLRDRLHLYGHVLSPDRIPVDTWDGLESLWVYEAENNARSMVNVIPAVKYRNRWSKVAAGFSLAGDYYVSVGMTTEHGGKNLAGVPIPIKFSIAVNGTTSGQPAYAGTAPSAQASRAADGVTNGSPTPDAAGSTRPSGDAESATPVALWGGLGALVLLGGAATAYAMRRRHSHADTTTGPIA
ncbi:hypothetical protein GCM10011314_24710 [Knoellia flava]|uniref:VWFA domain-containing protein n=3 Tax=Knoellia flava TaxID=913969 RepID=A0A8H9FTN1_9MICO|nr:hypothetical protein GCM10011314_24710 [Knoellia flava]